MSPTELTVDLRAIAHNLEILRSRGSGRRIIAAVKADAYGHGLIPVAQYIEPIVDGFGVATVDEGLRLRAAGISKLILKFSPALPDELPAAIASGLTLVVGHLDDIAGIANQAAAVGRGADVHLAVDTGMRRIGVLPEQVADALSRIQARPELRLQGVMTHFAVADVEDGREFTALQRERFAEARRVVGDVPWVHSGNSAGILNHDLGDDTAMRPGIAMYGCAPEQNRGEQDLLEPVVRWTSRVTLVKDVAAGEGVSYGLTWAAERATRIATVAVGYGDGFSRRNSSRGRVLIGGTSYPVVGRVCMDQILVDVGPGSTISPGDEVVLLGASGEERITVQEMADLMETIPYEVTCLITARVPRRYVR